LELLLASIVGDQTVARGVDLTEWRSAKALHRSAKCISGRDNARVVPTRSSTLRLDSGDSEQQNPAAHFQQTRSSGQKCFAASTTSTTDRRSDFQLEVQPYLLALARTTSFECSGLKPRKAGRNDVSPWLQPGKIVISTLVRQMSRHDACRVILRRNQTPESGRADVADWPVSVAFTCAKADTVEPRHKSRHVRKIVK